MLAQMQFELEERFAALAAARRPFGYPVYALEHDLGPDAIGDLGRAASVQLQKSGPVDQHWLVWTVLAAEAGYRYAGDEYWPALEVATDEWRNNNYRDWLRSRFRRFRAKFGGPVPVGRWADHFSIISWPIANAILPRYLQAHFARHLYELRAVLADVANTEAAKVGQVLCDYCDGSSSRFADFLQQVDLTTQIVMALRDEDLGDAAPRIVPALLGRIVVDLEERRESREYLRAARKVISARRATATVGLSGPGSSRAPADKNIAPVAGPKLAARRVGDGSVIVGLIYPDFAAALARADIPQAALAAARIKLAGSASRLEPALGLITFSKKDRQLEAMPAAGIPVISLETTDPALWALLAPLLMIPEQKSWVLRRQADGLYREVVGGHVRTGYAYMILARSAWPDLRTAIAGLQPCSVSTTGLCAYALEVGDRLPEVQRAALAEFGIGAVMGTRIEPVGLAPSFPGPARMATWLVTETVTLRVVADFDAGGFSVRLDDGQAHVLGTSNGELLIGLDPLSLGAHRLSVQALTRAGDLRSAVGETVTFEFCIAAPRPWQEGMRGKAGFRAFVVPPGASLEELLAGRAALTLFGPAGRTVHWSLETYDVVGHLAASSNGSPTRVGANPKAIGNMLDRLCQSQPDAIDNAHRVDIVAALGELGRQALAFPHRVEPLRWHFDPARQVARLIDETAHEAPVTVRSYSLASPLQERPIGYDEAIAGIAIAPPGALLVAALSSRRYAIFASAPAKERLRALSELGIPQTLALKTPAPEALVILLSSLVRWDSARSVGVQGIVRKTMTLEKIRAEIAALACGRDFVAALALRETMPFARAQALVGGSPGFGLRMRTFSPPESATEGHREIADIARRYSVERDPARCAEAYTLAFDPLSLRMGIGDAARDAATTLLANRTLVRGVYLAHAAVRSFAEAPIAKSG